MGAIQEGDRRRSCISKDILLHLARFAISLDSEEIFVSNELAKVLGLPFCWRGVRVSNGGKIRSKPVNNLPEIL